MMHIHQIEVKNIYWIIYISLDPLIGCKLILLIYNMVRNLTWNIKDVHMHLQSILLFYYIYIYDLQTYTQLNCIYVQLHWNKVSIFILCRTYIQFPFYFWLLLRQFFTLDLAIDFNVLDYGSSGDGHACW